MPIKTYVLLDALDSTAPIYQTASDGQRAQIRKIPRFRPFLQVTFQDKDGNGKTIRYKATSDVVDLQEQIDKKKIPANEKFTDRERDALWFKFGILATNNVNLQRFLEAHPGFEGFEGTCDDVPNREFKLLDEAADAKKLNATMKLHVKAAGVIMGLNLEQAQAMLIRLNGSAFKTPDDVEECQNMLMDFQENTNEAGINAILKEETETTVDEKTTILIGKLINAKVLSFDEKPDTVSKKGVDGNWIDLRTISNEYSLEQRIQYFSEFLITEDGKLMKADLEKELKAVLKKEKEAKK